MFTYLRYFLNIFGICLTCCPVGLGLVLQCMRGSSSCAGYHWLPAFSPKELIYSKWLVDPVLHWVPTATSSGNVVPHSPHFTSMKPRYMQRLPSASVYERVLKLYWILPVASLLSKGTEVFKMATGPHSTFDSQQDKFYRCCTT